MTLRPAPTPPATSSSSAPRLLDQVRAAARLRHYGPRTEEAYVAWIRRYVLFHGRRHPRVLGASEATAFLSHLADGGASASTQNQALSALLFLYQAVLKTELPWLHELVRAQGPARLPTVLSRDEAVSLLIGTGCQFAALGTLVRERGHVQWFKSDEGYGQIVSDQLGDELLVHFSFVSPSTGFRTLPAGQRVEFTREIHPGPSGSRAVAQSVVVVSTAS